jgi:hypothetical protein
MSSLGWAWKGVDAVCVAFRRAKHRRVGDKVGGFAQDREHPERASWASCRPSSTSPIRRTSTTGVASATTDTFLGDRYRRLVKRMGQGRALVALQRSILVIVYELLSDRTSGCRDLEGASYAKGTDIYMRALNHIEQLQALGFQVTIALAA